MCSLEGEHTIVEKGRTLKFVEKLLAASRRNDSLVCVGLDTELARLPVSFRTQDDPIFEFNKAIIEATQDLVCAYKPNLAFYEAEGWRGLQSLERTIRLIPPEIPVIGDAKRGDIGHTAAAYARALFDIYGFDAVTVNPYLGRDSLEPFLAREEKGVIVLCRTSNPGAKDFQDLLCREGIGGTRPGRPSEEEPHPLYQVVAEKVRAWNTNGNCGLVVGATYPDELRVVRSMCPDMPILVPGVGAQAADLAAVIRNGVDEKGELAIVNSSRAIIYASSGDDFAAAARREAASLRSAMNHFRQVQNAT
ncbi:MAG: orotidine-5'-phosphate decarboxylase [Chloroflexi bacterium]|nr:orotidine-5'-phosphate decarboxylase [Chloroflexota bacterium]